jgi:hypothetical protein
VDVTTHDERWLTVDDCSHYPLFTPQLIERMRQLLTPERQRAVARSMVFTARRP